MECADDVSFQFNNTISLVGHVLPLAIGYSYMEEIQLMVLSKSDRYDQLKWLPGKFVQMLLCMALEWRFAKWKIMYWIWI